MPRKRGGAKKTGSQQKAVAEGQPPAAPPAPAGEEEIRVKPQPFPDEGETAQKFDARLHLWMRQTLSAVQRMHERAQYAMARGDYAVALPNLQRAVDSNNDVYLCKGTPPDRNPHVLIMLEDLGVVLERLGDHKRARQVLLRAFQAQSDFNRRDHTALATKALELALACRHLDESEAIKYMDEAVNILSREGLDRSPTGAKAHMAKGVLLTDLDRCREGSESLNVAVAIFRAAHGGVSKEVGTAMSALSRALHGSAMQLDAISHMLDALDIIKTTLGPTHPEAILALECLGQWRHHQGQYAIALAYWEEALAALRERIGPDQPRTVAAVCEVALLQGEVAATRLVYNEPEAALALATEAAATARAYPDDCEPETLPKALTVVGQVLHRANKQYTEAEAALREAVALFRECGDVDYLPRALVALADLLMTVDQRFLEAQPLLQEAVSVLPPSEPRSARQMVDLGAASGRLGLCLAMSDAFTSSAWHLRASLDHAHLCVVPQALERLDRNDDAGTLGLLREAVEAMDVGVQSDAILVSRGLACFARLQLRQQRGEPKWWTGTRGARGGDMEPLDDDDGGDEERGSDDAVDVDAGCGREDGPTAAAAGGPDALRTAEAGGVPGQGGVDDDDSDDDALDFENAAALDEASTAVGLTADALGSARAVALTAVHNCWDQLGPTPELRGRCRVLRDALAVLRDACMYDGLTRGAREPGGMASLQAAVVVARLLPRRGEFAFGTDRARRQLAAALRITGREDEARAVELGEDGGWFEDGPPPRGLDLD